MIGMNFAYYGCLDVYGTGAVFESLSTHLLDGRLYPNFLEWPDSQPALNFVSWKNTSASACRYSVMASGAARRAEVGFHSPRRRGRAVFTGTRPESVGCWEQCLLT